MAKRFIFLCFLSFALVGCSLVNPRPTPEPIYVTATPSIPTDTETPVDTPVLGSTDLPSDTPPLLPTLVPPTSMPTVQFQPPPSLTASFTPEFTDTLPPTPTKVKCTATPPGGFGTIYKADKTLVQALGCPLGTNYAIKSAVLSLQNGSMLWASQFADQQMKMIYVLYNNATFQRYEDNWIDKVDPETTGETAPAGLFTPARGFGKVWHNNPAVKNGLGWAKGGETGTDGQIQRFERGEMLFVVSLGQTFIFIDNGTPAGSWRSNPTPF